MPIIITSSGGSDEVLIFDADGSGPNGENPGDPLAIGPGTNYPIIEHTYPAPPLNVLYSSSIDTEGENPVSRRHGNREITIRFEMDDETGALQAAFEAKYAKLQREGGTLSRTFKNGDVRIYDLCAADGWSPVYDLKYYLGHVTEASVVLPGRPYSRGAEEEL